MDSCPCILTISEIERLPTAKEQILAGVLYVWQLWMTFVSAFMHSFCFLSKSWITMPGLCVLGPCPFCIKTMGHTSGLSGIQIILVPTTTVTVACINSRFHLQYLVISLKIIAILSFICRLSGPLTPRLRSSHYTLTIPLVHRRAPDLILLSENISHSPTRSQFPLKGSGFLGPECHNKSYGRPSREDGASPKSESKLAHLIVPRSLFCQGRWYCIPRRPGTRN